GEVIELGLGRVHADRMGDLRGRVDVQVGGIGDHPAEQSEVDGMLGVERLLQPCRFQRRDRVVAGVRGERGIGEPVDLASAEEQEVARLIRQRILLGRATRRGELEAGGGEGELRELLRALGRDRFVLRGDARGE
ncbi:hypothetical protein ABE10_02270, partial [Bacillus toyonensis]|nr:hypothetical protein [Bacillus toyonensis]